MAGTIDDSSNVSIYFRQAVAKCPTSYCLILTPTTPQTSDAAFFGQTWATTTHIPEWATETAPVDGWPLSGAVEADSSQITANRSLMSRMAPNVGDEDHLHPISVCDLVPSVTEVTLFTFIPRPSTSISTVLPRPPGTLFTP